MEIKRDSSWFQGLCFSVGTAGLLRCVGVKRAVWTPAQADRHGQKCLLCPLVWVVFATSMRRLLATYSPSKWARAAQMRGGGASAWPFASASILALAIFALEGCGGGQSSTAAAPLPADPPVAVVPSIGVLSITGIPRLDPYPSSAVAIAAAYSDAADLAYAAGARGQQLNFSWGELESAAGVYDAARMAELSSAVNVAKARSLVQYVGIQPINTQYRDVPADLVGRAFDDPVLIARFHALLDRVVGQNRGRIQYLSLGNEVDIYLGAHPAELAAFTTFMRDALAYTHGLDPAVKVGVTGTGDGLLGDKAALLKQLNDAGTDVVILTYYPIHTDAAGVVSVRDPSVVAADMTQFLAFSGSKPLVFQEVGFPSSVGNLSSEPLQAIFIHQLFAAWELAGQRIPYLNLFALHDFTPAMCADLAAHYQRPGVTSFQDYLCTLGLRHADGSVKVSWQAVTDEAARVLFRKP